MQAITIAIGKTGIDFFVQKLVAQELVGLLNGLQPPDKTINIGTLIWNQDLDKAEDIMIYLTQGKMSNFSPAFSSISQESGGVFPITLQAGGFGVSYNWEEKWRAFVYIFNPRTGNGAWQETMWSPVDKNFPYNPAFSGLTVNIPLQFEYEEQNQTWSLVAGDSSGSAVSSSADIPSDSVIQQEDQECFSSHVSDATASAIAEINFSSSLNKIIAGNIASIPGSGNLGDGMVYDFSLGDSGILFPNNDGIQMAVKGGASFNGVSFSGVAPPSLPLPVPPSDADTHHLNMYVSNYEIDALNWAYFKAGKLNSVITPQDLADPKLLDVSSYLSLANHKLDPFAPFVMYASIVQSSAPVTSFQTVYIYDSTVMSLLQSQLPTNIYTLIEGLGGNAYLSVSDVETFLNEANIPNQYFSQIENAAKTSAMVLTQNIDFTLTIQNNHSPQPVINFSVTRDDVLIDLQLGVSTNNAQTIQFGFINVDNTATFLNSSIAGLDGTIFESLWQLGLENSYMTILQALGKTGTPLPIMENFQFDFTNAHLSIQNGYISILADVLYKS